MFFRRAYCERSRKNYIRKIYGGGEAEWYRKKIIKMTDRIENERFLKAIYISMSDYLKENEPD